MILKKKKTREKMYRTYLLTIFNKEILKEACSPIVLYFPTVLIFQKRSDKTLLLLFTKSNALTPENAGGSGSFKILSDMGRN